VAVPVARFEKVIEIPREKIESSGNETFAEIDDEPVPVLRLAARMTLESERRVGAAVPPRVERREAPDSGNATLVITEVREERFAIRVERVVGQQQIYVKPVPELLAGVRALAGLTILGDGRPVFVLDLKQMG